MHARRDRGKRRACVPCAVDASVEPNCAPVDMSIGVAAISSGPSALAAGGVTPDKGKGPKPTPAHAHSMFDYINLSTHSPSKLSSHIRVRKASLVYTYPEGRARRP